MMVEFFIDSILLRGDRAAAPGFLKQLMGDASDLLAMFDDCRVRDPNLTRRLAHAVTFQQQEEHALLHISEAWNDLIDDICGDDFTLDLNGGPWLGQNAITTTLIFIGWRLIKRHAFISAFVRVNAAAKFQVVTRMELAALQVPTQCLTRFDGLDASQVQKHFLHQIFLQLGICREPRRNSTQLSNDHIFRHLTRTFPLLPPNSRKPHLTEPWTTLQLDKSLLKSVTTPLAAYVPIKTRFLGMRPWRARNSRDLRRFWSF
jgi:hypothetical protein